MLFSFSALGSFVLFCFVCFLALSLSLSLFRFASPFINLIKLHIYRHVSLTKCYYHYNWIRLLIVCSRVCVYVCVCVFFFFSFFLFLTFDSILPPSHFYTIRHHYLNGNSFLLFAFAGSVHPHTSYVLPLRPFPLPPVPPFLPAFFSSVCIVSIVNHHQSYVPSLPLPCVAPQVKSLHWIRRESAVVLFFSPKRNTKS